MSAPLPFGRILFIGAHPDDESLIAPLLGRFCVDGRSVCAFIVMTRGESGGCVLPGGCGADLGTVRAAEMQSAAAFFHATLTQWSYPDRMTDVAEAWQAAAGGRDALVNRLRDAIAAEHPTAVMTFDPTHGSTCHPAHREVGALVIDAVARLDPVAPKVYLIEAGVNYRNGFYSFLNAAPVTASSLDGSTSWRYLISDLTVHASQFTGEEVSAIRATPIEQQRVYLAPASCLAGIGYAFQCQ